MDTRTSVCLCFLVTATLVLLGCGPGNPLGAIPVKGTVTYNGKPLQQGEVLYNPVDTKGRRAKGKIQSDGTFRLTTLETNDGAVPGEYQISILAYAPHPGEPTRTEASEQRDQIKQRIQRGHIIPERYTDPETSGLTDVVDKSHSGFKEITLED